MAKQLQSGPNTYGGRSTVLDVEPLRVGLVGAGGIAQSHQRGYVAAGAKLLAFAEPVETTRARREVEWGIKGYPSLDAMLAAEDLEAVSICTPNAFHADATIAAAKAGKHVLCEKPLAMSLDRCEDMIRVCREAGVVLQTGHHLRSNLYVEKARQIVDSGGIGTVCFIRARQAHDWGGKKTVSPSFGLLKNSGGGTMLDNGCHMFDLCRYFGGDVSNVFARIATRGFDIEVEDVSAASLGFASGAIGSVENAWTATGWEESFAIYGTDGAIECSNRSGERHLRFVHRSSAGTTWDALDEDIYRYQAEGGHPRSIVNFIRSIRLGDPVVCTGEDGRESVRLVLKAYESARSGSMVAI